MKPVLIFFLSALAFGLVLLVIGIRVGDGDLHRPGPTGPRGPAPAPFLLRILDGDGRPVSGVEAEVRDELACEMIGHGDQNFLPAAKATSDGDGMLRIESGHRSIRCRLIDRARGRGGMLVLDRFDRGLVRGVPELRTRAIFARVEDEAGRPVTGLPVTLFKTDAREVLVSLDRAPSDEKGEVVLLARWCDEGDELWLLAERQQESWPPAVRVDAGNPLAPRRLRLASSASITLVFQPLDRLLIQGAAVAVLASTCGSPSELEPPGRLPILADELVYPSVAPGLDWRLRVEDRLGRGDRTLVFRGPTAPGENLRIELPPAELEGTGFEFRVLDEGGRRLEGEVLILHDHRLRRPSRDEEPSPRDGLVGGVPLYVDAEGRGAFLLDGPAREGIEYRLARAADVPVTAMFTDSHGIYGGPIPNHARVRPPERLWQAVEDLGILGMREQPLAFSGRVLEEEGRPLAFARLAFARQERSGAPAKVSGDNPFAVTIADAEGRFEIRRDPDHDLEGEDGLYTLEASAPGRRTVVLADVALHAEDLCLALPRAVDLEIELVVDEGLDVGKFELEAMLPAGPLVAGNEEPVPIEAKVLDCDDDGLYRIWRAPIARLGLRLRSTGTKGLATLRRDIDIERLVPASDPRLPLRIRADFRDGR